MCVEKAGLKHIQWQRESGMNISRQKDGVLLSLSGLLPVLWMKSSLYQDFPVV
jgi:hypothetical protein